MNRLYIAYGSNTNQKSMETRCPQAEFIGTGTLKGYNLAFRGHPNNSYATIEKDEKSNLEVALWIVSQSDEKHLDNYEGYPELYRKETIKVEVGNSTLDGLVYIMNEGYELALPSESYFNEVLDGYTQCSLDTEPLFQAMFNIRDNIS
jgi:gamma-glutamylcyclotransferase (GGCT)/AIG2-like uncharacterized protein YtfP